MAILLNNVPLVILLIEINLHLNHALLRLLHRRHLNAKMGQMSGELWILHHCILIVRVHIRASGGNSAQLHHQWILGRLVVVRGVIVAACSIEKFPTTVDPPVCEIEPETGTNVAALTLPAGGWDGRWVEQLRQTFGMSRIYRKGKWIKIRAGARL